PGMRSVGSSRSACFVSLLAVHHLELVLLVGLFYVLFFSGFYTLSLLGALPICSVFMEVSSSRFWTLEALSSIVRSCFYRGVALSVPTLALVASVDAHVFFFFFFLKKSYLALFSLGVLCSLFPLSLLMVFSTACY